MKNIYLFLLAALVGMEFVMGVFVAPAIFYPQRFMPDISLSHFESGIIMTQIFVKYNYVLLFVSVFAVIFELLNLKNKECFHVKVSANALAFINLALALVFVFYFTQFIVDAQLKGQEATIGNAEFDTIHKASEYTMKLMMLAQFLLFFVKSLKSKSQCKDQI